MRRDETREILVRTARAGEEAELADRSCRSFRMGDLAGWERYYREHAHLEPRDTLVAEVDGRPAGQASALRLTMRLAGVDIPVRGIAAVAVLPEYRRRGVADLLMRAWLARMRRRGEALAALYPFHAPFYAKFGFGRCEWGETRRLDPAELPASDLARHVRRLERPDDLPAIARTYDAWRADRTGPLARSDYWWRVRVLERAPEGVVYRGGPSAAVEGYLLYEVPAQAKHVGRQALIVREAVAATPEAWRGLWGFIHALAEQFAEIHLLLPGDDLRVLLTDAGRAETSPHFHHYQVQGQLAAGMMVRVVDIPLALALHPGPARAALRATVGLDLRDPVFVRQASFDVRLGPGALRAAPGKRARHRLALGVDRFAQVYAGSVSARLLLQQGLAQGSATAAAALDRAFAGPKPFLSPLNGF